METKIRFSEIEDKVPDCKRGIYEIHTDNGIPLKVGISVNIKNRLRQHRDSYDRYLKLKPSGNRDNPNDVKSKRSILAKHLYYDESLSDEYNLKHEDGRQKFLENRCHIKFKTTRTKANARSLEKLRENCGCFRYTGKVVKR
jgi:hypothetical protein